MALSSYDELLKQVESLKSENCHLRQELKDNSSHLTKLENDATTMQDVLSHMVTPYDPRTFPSSQSEGGGGGGDGHNANLVAGSLGLAVQSGNTLGLEDQTGAMDCGIETGAEMESFGGFDEETAIASHSSLCEDSFDDDLDPRQGQALEEGQGGPDAAMTRKLQKLELERNRLMQEVEKEEEDHHWYQSQLQTITDKLEGLQVHSSNTSQSHSKTKQTEQNLSASNNSSNHKVRRQLEYQTTNPSSSPHNQSATSVPVSQRVVVGGGGYNNAVGDDDDDDGDVVWKQQEPFDTVCNDDRNPKNRPSATVQQGDNQTRQVTTVGSSNQDGVIGAGMSLSRIYHGAWPIDQGKHGAWPIDQGNHGAWPIDQGNHGAWPIDQAPVSTSQTHSAAATPPLQDLASVISFNSTNTNSTNASQAGNTPGQSGCAVVPTTPSSVNPNSSVTPSTSTTTNNNNNSSNQQMPSSSHSSNSSSTVGDEGLSSLTTTKSPGSTGVQPLGSKVEMVYSLLSMLGTHDKDDMSRTLFAMSQSQDSCIAMRQSGCLPLLLQLLHGSDKDSGLLGKTRGSKDARARAAAALHNIVHCNHDDKKGRREARTLRLLEQIRAYCDQERGEEEEEEEEEGGGGGGGGSARSGGGGVGAVNASVSMDHHPGAAIAALMKLSFDEDYRHAICTLGGLQAIAELLEVEVKEEDGVKVTSVNTMTALSDLDHDYNSTTVRRYACMALTNLTFGDGKNKALLCSMPGPMKALVLQLQSANEDLIQAAASVLRNLSWRADLASKKTLRELGGVTILMKAAMSAKKETTLKSILSALWNLSSHCSENKAEICAVSGALQYLVSLLSYKSSSKTLAIVENGGGILRNVSSQIAIREDYRKVLRRLGCLQILLNHLRSTSLTIVSNACGTLWNLSARCEEDQKTLRDLGAIAMLRNLVHSRHKMISSGSSAALRNLLSSVPNVNESQSGDKEMGGRGADMTSSLSSTAALSPSSSSSSSVPQNQNQKHPRGENTSILVTPSKSEQQQQHQPGYHNQHRSESEPRGVSYGTKTSTVSSSMPNPHSLITSSSSSSESTRVAGNSSSSCPPVQGRHNNTLDNTSGNAVSKVDNDDTRKHLTRRPMMPRVGSESVRKRVKSPLLSSSSGPGQRVPRAGSQDSVGSTHSDISHDRTRAHHMLAKSSHLLNRRQGGSLERKDCGNNHRLKEPSPHRHPHRLAHPQPQQKQYQQHLQDRIKHGLEPGFVGGMVANLSSSLPSTSAGTTTVSTSSSSQNEQLHHYHQHPHPMSTMMNQQDGWVNSVPAHGWRLTNQHTANHLQQQQWLSMSVVSPQQQQQQPQQQPNSRIVQYMQEVAMLAGVETSAALQLQPTTSSASSSSIAISASSATTTTTASSSVSSYPQHYPPSSALASSSLRDQTSSSQQQQQQQQQFLRERFAAKNRSDLDIGPQHSHHHHLPIFHNNHHHHHDDYDDQPVNYSLKYRDCADQASDLDPNSFSTSSPSLPLHPNPLPSSTNIQLLSSLSDSLNNCTGVGESKGGRQYHHHINNNNNLYESPSVDGTTIRPMMMTSAPNFSTPQTPQSQDLGRDPQPPHHLYYSHHHAQNHPHFNQNRFSTPQTSSHKGKPPPPPPPPPPPLSHSSKFLPSPLMQYSFPNNSGIYYPSDSTSFYHHHHHQQQQQHHNPHHQLLPAAFSYQNQTPNLPYTPFYNPQPSPLSTSTAPHAMTFSQQQSAAAAAHHQNAMRNSPPIASLPASSHFESLGMGVGSTNRGAYAETDLDSVIDQPTDFSLRYGEFAEDGNGAVDDGHQESSFQDQPINYSMRFHGNKTNGATSGSTSAAVVEGGLEMSSGASASANQTRNCTDMGDTGDTGKDQYSRKLEALRRFEDERHCVECKYQDEMNRDRVGSSNDDQVQTFCTEGTPYLSNATSLTDLRHAGKDEEDEDEEEEEVVEDAPGEDGERGQKEEGNEDDCKNVEEVVDHTDIFGYGNTKDVTILDVGDKTLTAASVPDDVVSCGEVTASSCGSQVTTDRLTGSTVVEVPGQLVNTGHGSQTKGDNKSEEIQQFHADDGNEGSLDQTKTYAEEGTPVCFSRVSSLSSLHSGDLRQPAPTATTTATKAVTAGHEVDKDKANLGHTEERRSADSIGDVQKVASSGVGGGVSGGAKMASVSCRQNNNNNNNNTNYSRVSPSMSSLPAATVKGVSKLRRSGGGYHGNNNNNSNQEGDIGRETKTVTFDDNHQVEETPLMFSRSSSPESLSSFDTQSMHSSVVSEYSRRASEVVSPSEIPDSPSESMPSSPKRGHSPNPHHRLKDFTSTPKQPHSAHSVFGPSGGVHSNNPNSSVKHAVAEFSSPTAGTTSAVVKTPSTIKAAPFVNLDAFDEEDDRPINFAMRTQELNLLPIMPFPHANPTVLGESDQPINFSSFDREDGNSLFPSHNNFYSHHHHHHHLHQKQHQQQRHQQPVTFSTFQKTVPPSSHSPRSHHQMMTYMSSLSSSNNHLSNVSYSLNFAVPVRFSSPRSNRTPMLPPLIEQEVGENESLMSGKSEVPVVYAEEGTPPNFSETTSLSSITLDQDIPNTNTAGNSSNDMINGPPILRMSVMDPNKTTQSTVAIVENKQGIRLHQQQQQHQLVPSGGPVQWLGHNNPSNRMLTKLSERETPNQQQSKHNLSDTKSISMNNHGKPLPKEPLELSTVTPNLSQQQQQQNLPSTTSLAHRMPAANSSIPPPTPPRTSSLQKSNSKADEVPLAKLPPTTSTTASSSSSSSSSSSPSTSAPTPAPMLSTTALTTTTTTTVMKTVITPDSKPSSLTMESLKQEDKDSSMSEVSEGEEDILAQCISSAMPTPNSSSRKIRKSSSDNALKKKSGIPTKSCSGESPSVKTKAPTSLSSSSGKPSSSLSSLSSSKSAASSVAVPADSNKSVGQNASLNSKQACATSSSSSSSQRSCSSGTKVKSASMASTPSSSMTGHKGNESNRVNAPLSPAKSLGSGSTVRTNSKVKNTAIVTPNKRPSNKIPNSFSPSSHSHPHHSITAVPDTGTAESANKASDLSQTDAKNNRSQHNNEISSQCSIDSSDNNNKTTSTATPMSMLMMMMTSTSSPGTLTAPLTTVTNPVILMNNLDEFESDTVCAFATEGTPLNFSNSTSLSDLSALTSGTDKTNQCLSPRRRKDGGHTKNPSTDADDYNNGSKTNQNNMAAGDKTTGVVWSDDAASDNSSTCEENEDKLLSDLIQTGMPKNRYGGPSHVIGAGSARKSASNSGGPLSSTSSTAFTTSAVTVTVTTTCDTLTASAVCNFNAGTKRQASYNPVTQPSRDSNPSAFIPRVSNLSVVPPFQDFHLDTVKSYNVEGTPRNFSTATSLSDLTIDSMEGPGSFRGGCSKKGGGGNTDGGGGAKRQGNERGDGKSINMNSAREGGGGGRGAGSGGGVRENNQGQQRNLGNNDNSQHLMDCKGIEFGVSQYPVTFSPPSNDTLHTYQVEGTPNSFSRRDSLSSLGIADSDRDDCNIRRKAGDCNEKGAERDHESDSSQSIPKERHVIGQSSEDSSIAGDKGVDGPIRFAVEDTPVTFSRNSSLSSLTSIDRIDPNNLDALSPCKNQTSDKKVTAVDIRDKLESGSHEDIDSDEGGDCDPTPSEQLLLEQCIYAALPKSRLPLGEESARRHSRAKFYIQRNSPGFKKNPSSLSSNLSKKSTKTGGLGQSNCNNAGRLAKSFSLEIPKHEDTEDGCFGNPGIGDRDEDEGSQLSIDEGSTGYDSLMTRSCSDTRELDLDYPRQSRYSAWRRQRHMSQEELGIGSEKAPCDRSHSQDSQPNWKEQKEISNKLAKKAGERSGSRRPGSLDSLQKRDCGGLDELQTASGGVWERRDGKNLIQRQSDYCDDGVRDFAAKVREISNDSMAGLLAFRDVDEWDKVIVGGKWTGGSSGDPKEVELENEVVDVDVLGGGGDGGRVGDSSGIEQDGGLGDDDDDEDEVGGYRDDHEDDTIVDVNDRFDNEERDGVENDEDIEKWNPRFHIDDTMVDDLEDECQSVELTAEEEHQLLMDNIHLVVSEIHQRYDDSNTSGTRLLSVSGSTIDEDMFIQHETISLVSNDYNSDSNSESGDHISTGTTMNLLGSNPTVDNSTDATTSAFLSDKNPPSNGAKVLKPGSAPRAGSGMAMSDDQNAPGNKGIRGRRKPLYPGKPTTASASVLKSTSVGGRINLNSHQNKTEPTVVGGAKSGTGIRKNKNDGKVLTVAKVSPRTKVVNQSGVQIGSTNGSAANSHSHSNTTGINANQKGSPAIGRGRGVALAVRSSSVGGRASQSPSPRNRKSPGVANAASTNHNGCNNKIVDDTVTNSNHAKQIAGQPRSKSKPRSNSTSNIPSPRTIPTLVGKREPNRDVKSIPTTSNSSPGENKENKLGRETSVEGEVIMRKKKALSSNSSSTGSTCHRHSSCSAGSDGEAGSRLSTGSVSESWTKALDSFNFIVDEAQDGMAYKRIQAQRNCHEAPEALKRALKTPSNPSLAALSPSPGVHKEQKQPENDLTGETNKGKAVNGNSRKTFSNNNNNTHVSKTSNVLPKTSPLQANAKKLSGKYNTTTISSNIPKLSAQSTTTLKTSTARTTSLDSSNRKTPPPPTSTRPMTPIGSQGGSSVASSRRSSSSSVSSGIPMRKVDLSNSNASPKSADHSSPSTPVRKSPATGGIAAKRPSATSKIISVSERSPSRDKKNTSSSSSSSASSPTLSSRLTTTSTGKSNIARYNNTPTGKPSSLPPSGIRAKAATLPASSSLSTTSAKSKSIASGICKSSTYEKITSSILPSSSAHANGQQESSSTNKNTDTNSNDTPIQSGKKLIKNSTFTKSDNKRKPQRMKSNDSLGSEVKKTEAYNSPGSEIRKGEVFELFDDSDDKYNDNDVDVDNDNGGMKFANARRSIEVEMNQTSDSYHPCPSDDADGDSHNEDDWNARYHIDSSTFKREKRDKNIRCDYQLPNADETCRASPNPTRQFTSGEGVGTDLESTLLKIAGIEGTGVVTDSYGILGGSQTLYTYNHINSINRPLTNSCNRSDGQKSNPVEEKKCNGSTMTSTSTKSKVAQGLKRFFGGGKHKDKDREETDGGGGKSKNKKKSGKKKSNSKEKSTPNTTGKVDDSSQVTIKKKDEYGSVDNIGGDNNDDDDGGIDDDDYNSMSGSFIEKTVEDTTAPITRMTHAAAVPVLSANQSHRQCLHPTMTTSPMSSVINAALTTTTTTTTTTGKLVAVPPNTNGLSRTEHKSSPSAIVAPFNYSPPVTNLDSATVVVNNHRNYTHGRSNSTVLVVDLDPGASFNDSSISSSSSSNNNSSSSSNNNSSRSSRRNNNGSIKNNDSHSDNDDMHKDISTRNGMNQSSSTVIELSAETAQIKEDVFFTGGDSRKKAESLPPQGKKMEEEEDGFSVMKEVGKSVLTKTDMLLARRKKSLLSTSSTTTTRSEDSLNSDVSSTGSRGSEKTKNMSGGSDVDHLGNHHHHTLTQQQQQQANQADVHGPSCMVTTV